MFVGLVVINGSFDVEKGLLFMFEMVEVQLEFLVDFLAQFFCWVGLFDGVRVRLFLCLWLGMGHT